MGYIDPVYFLGGEMPIDTSLAQSGIKSKVCKPLKMDFESGAWGMLKVDLRYDLAQTLLIKRLGESDLNELNNRFGELIKEGMDILKEEGIPAEKRASFKSLDLRYPGQEHTVNVPLDFAIDENSRDKIYEEFSKVYQGTFGYTLNRPAEVIVLRVRCIGEVAKPVIHELEAGTI